MNPGYILVVDDEPDICRLVQEILEDEHYKVVTAENAGAARDAFKKQRPDLVLLDIWMPDTDGISLLREWSDSGDLEIPVIMISGHGTVETAVEATRLGAYDFIEKPLSTGKLLVTVERALENDKLRRENLRLRRQSEPASTLIGKSPLMQQLREDIERIAATDAWVLITGERGALPARTQRAQKLPLRRSQSRRGSPRAIGGAAVRTRAKRVDHSGQLRAGGDRHLAAE
jgi:DNA-binding NtrC family response regulator